MSASANGQDIIKFQPSSKLWTLAAISNSFLFQMNINKNQSIALFVGAGAVKNAWRPIINAVQPPYFKEELTTEGANSGLARLVYMLRWFSNNPGDGLDKCKQILESAKLRICEEIKTAQQKNEIFIRDEFSKIINQIIISDCNRLMIVSTNWDTIVEDAVNSTPAIQSRFNKIFAAHIHGVYLDSQNIYLPTEVVEEPYRADNERKFLGGMHAAVMQAMTFAQTIFIYGLSISPLDAELTQIIAACCDHPNIKAIKIVDPNHKAVAEKINLLIKYPTKITVEGYDPNDLDTCYDYSLQ